MTSTTPTVDGLPSARSPRYRKAGDSAAFNSPFSHLQADRIQERFQSIRRYRPAPSLRNKGAYHLLRLLPIRQANRATHQYNLHCGVPMKTTLTILLRQGMRNAPIQLWSGIAAGVVGEARCTGGSVGKSFINREVSAVVLGFTDCYL